jgi:hypothetical protein
VLRSFLLFFSLFNLPARAAVLAFCFTAVMRFTLRLKQFSSPETLRAGARADTTDYCRALFLMRQKFAATAAQFKQRLLLFGCVWGLGRITGFLSALQGGRDVLSSFVSNRAHLLFPRFALSLPRGPKSTSLIKNNTISVLK